MAEGTLTVDGTTLDIKRFKVTFTDNFLVDPEPGFTPIALGRKDECMRLSIACCIGVEPIHIDWVPVKGIPFDVWCTRWRNICRDHGWRLMSTWTNEQFYEPRGYWIAVVQSNTRTKCHAVVMKGNKLHYDCAFNPQHRRKQRPHKFLGAFYLDRLKDIVA